MAEEPTIRPDDEQEPGSAAGGAPAPGAAADGGAGAEPVARLALVVLGIAVLGLITWWLSPGDDAPPPTTTTDTPDAPAPDAVPEILISVFGGIDDRYFEEPCNNIPGGGLMAFRATVDIAREETIRNHLGVSMGDLSMTPGPTGIGVKELLLAEVLHLTGIDVMAAGVGELQHGVRYARGVLATVGGAAVLCANALDADGHPVLRGWAVTASGGHNVLTVAVAGESIGYELVARGSDVRIGPAADYASRALEEGVRRAEENGSPAMTRVLLVQGTDDEAAEIAREAPGFDVVVASRGPLLPGLEPKEIGGALLFYPGRGARFVWHVAKGGELDGVRHRLARMGSRAASRGSPYEEMLYGVGGRLLSVEFPSFRRDDVRAPDPRGDYAGAAACRDCHPDEFVQHAGSPHARVPKPVLEGRFSGSPACLPCHVTAPFRRGGWLPGDDAEGLAGVSCERCHGPGGAHANDPGPGYGAVDLADCHTCHLPDRSPGFEARAAWAASGHAGPPPPEEPEDGNDDGGDDGR